MKSRRFAMGLLTAVCLTFGSQARAMMVEHAIDTVHSSVVFKIEHNKLTHIYGRFDDISGVISIDSPLKPKKIEINVELKATSVDTNDKKRDRKLAGKDFFDTARFKKITFKSKSCKPLEEEGHYEIVGDLTMLGKTVELTIDFHLTGIVRDKGGSRLGGETTFTVKRSEFGMDKMLGGIGDEVMVMVSVQAAAKMVPSG